MPVWKKPVIASHRAKTQEGDNSRAGQPDFLLYHGRDRMQQSAIFEIKTFWPYRREHIARIFKDALCNDNRGFNIPKVGFLPLNATIPGTGGGFFDWRKGTIEAVILKQASTMFLILHCITNILHRSGESSSPTMQTGGYGPTDRLYLHSSSRRGTMLVSEAQPIS